MEMMTVHAKNFELGKSEYSYYTDLIIRFLNNLSVTQQKSN